MPGVGGIHPALQITKPRLKRGNDTPRVPKPVKVEQKLEPGLPLSKAVLLLRPGSLLWSGLFSWIWQDMARLPVVSVMSEAWYGKCRSLVGRGDRIETKIRLSSM